MVAAYYLENQEQALLEKFKSSKAWQSLTTWRAKNQHHQLICNTEMHSIHSQAREPRIKAVSMHEAIARQAVTHFLLSQGQRSSVDLNTQQVTSSSHSLENPEQTSAGLKYDMARQPTHSLEKIIVSSRVNS